jgi:hypothetical protein
MQLLVFTSKTITITKPMLLLTLTPTSATCGASDGSILVLLGGGTLWKVHAGLWWLPLLLLLPRVPLRDHQ